LIRGFCESPLTTGISFGTSHDQMLDGLRSTLA
jgi:hypothetical protein